MGPDLSGRWTRIEALFARAVELPRDARMTFLDSCDEDSAVRSELVRLLAAHDRAEGYLDQLDSTRAAALVHSVDVDVRDGEMIGRYRVIRRLGRGGMGHVLLAHDPALDRRVALKLLPARLNAAEKANQRLVEEAKAASALDHPHIATIHEIGDTEDGRRFIAMAYYEGQTLREMIARGPLSSDQAIAIATQVADGLRAAHQRGIVHRDIKPENVIVTADGVAKIVDFGIAKVTGRDIGFGAENIGTLAYMSPEQTRGKGVDARTDVWSLGAVLYEMLTGERPFRARDERELLHAIRTVQPAPLNARRTDLARPLVSIVERCLMKDSTNRFQTAAELLDELRALTAPRAALQLTRRRITAGSGVLIIGAAAAALTLMAPPGGTRHADAASIAVLPFMNFGADADDYLSDGVAEGVISALGRTPGLHVAARTSSFTFRGDDRNTAEISRALGVRHLLEGSVQRSGTRLRISVRLIDGVNGYHLWTETYDREYDDLFAVEDEISHAIADALSLRLTESPQAATARRPPGRMEALDLYLRGRHAWNKRTRYGIEQAIGYFEEATRLDSAYALAHAGLADAYISLGTYGLLPGDEAFGRARTAAGRALELDPALAEPHTSLGAPLVSERQFEQAEREYQRAIELNPSYAPAYHWYGFMLGILGRTDEALVHVGRALELDPLSLAIYNTQGRLLVHAGRPDLAIERMRRGIELDPTFPWTWHTLGLAYVARAEYDEAAAAFERVIERAPDQPGLLANIAAIRARAGQPDQARAFLERIGSTEQIPAVASGAVRQLDEYHIALLHAALGETGHAFDWLERVPWNSEFMFKLRTEPLLAPLRSHPRYSELLRALDMTT